MAATSTHLFEIETERLGMDSVRDLTGRLADAAHSAGGEVTEALVTSDLDHVFVFADVSDERALSRAVLELTLPGTIWISGPDPVWSDGDDTGPRTVRMLAEHDLGKAGAGTLREQARAHGADPPRVWLAADQRTAFALYASTDPDTLRTAAEAAGVSVDRLEPVERVELATGA